jgi:hypothetical protein
MNSQELRNLQEAYIGVYDEGYKSFPYEKVKAKSKKLKTDRESLGKKPLTGKSDSEISDTLNKMEKSRNRETKLGLQSNIAHSFVPKQKEKSNRNRPESEKRSKTVEPQKSFGNRLTRSDKQGIQDSYDLYDIILSHLLDEGYADTQEQAEVIMVNMSEDWRESICEEYKKLPVGKMIKQATRHSNPKQVTKMGKVADDHNPAKSKRKEDDNRREGGRKRDAGRPRSNELQDNW